MNSFQIFVDLLSRITTALRKIREGSKTNNENLLKEGQKEFVFATPKDSILPKIFNFKYYETARRINEQEEIRKSETYLDPRGKNEDTNISELLTRQTLRNSGKLNGFSRRSLGVSKRLGGYVVDVIAEYEGNQEIVVNSFQIFVDLLSRITTRTQSYTNIR
ncbi:hypothetical protein ACF3NR_02500 [Vaginella massiliensis]|uniref:hypothetical protein n=1 Tax=Vaginella massiliensis TaxID=1816680 RepID=UPI003753A95B